ncbi:hypothetical protein ACH4OY_18945 [Micromonospora rubida]|uniref:Uncharacterized protein n=1 Tax=Micromonospora rubida TaxID=2697657 RepID=A0ABW7SPB7_9ACTN
MTIGAALRKIHRIRQLHLDTRRPGRPHPAAVLKTIGVATVSYFIRLRSTPPGQPAA